MRCCVVGAVAVGGCCLKLGHPQPAFNPVSILSTWPLLFTYLTYPPTHRAQSYKDAAPGGDEEQRIGKEHDNREREG